MKKTTVELRLTRECEVARLVGAIKAASKQSAHSGGVRYIGLPLDSGPAEELLISIDLSSVALERYCRVGRGKKKI